MRTSPSSLPNGPHSLADIFDLNDYVKNYEALEQAGFKKANTSFWSSLGQALGLY
jgi:hypothetical protein